MLCLPRGYQRFPDGFKLPPLPDGVTVIWSDSDLGPTTKALPAAQQLAGSGTALIYCDDDWIVPPDWAAQLLGARNPGEAVAGSGYSVARLGRDSRATEGCTDIAQGFSGVLVDPAWLVGEELDPPHAAWAVDDIWLSGHLARQGIAIREVPEARAGMRPAFQDAHGLQDQRIFGHTRDQANRACAALLHQKYGIWPPEP